MIPTIPALIRGLTSARMLVDVDAGRPLDTEAILGAVVGLAGRVGVAASSSQAMLALVRQRAATRPAVRAIPSGPLDRGGAG